jgi:hypothetical protein
MGYTSAFLLLQLKLIYENIIKQMENLHVHVRVSVTMIRNPVKKYVAAANVTKMSTHAD